VASRSFPDGFTWGAATAAYQIEGAVREDGRGESIWDRFSHTEGRVRNGDTGDVACDHYHHYREDLALLAALGLNAYRFSVSWSRVLPAGTGVVNQAGLDFYDRLVDELLSHQVAPYLTLYHWDLPQALEDAGGWPARATAEAFADYAGIVAGRLGDRVRSIATLNEPWVSADHGYRTGAHAPGRRDPSAAIAAAHHLLLAHGLGMQAIRATAPQTPAGIVLNFTPQHPASGHPLDLEAAAADHDWLNRWFLDPLVGRSYPALPAWARGQARDQVRDGDMELIAAPLDFLGVNYYSRTVVRSPFLPPLEPAGGPPEQTGLSWEVYPAGLVEVLGFVASRTGSLPLYVTENGAAYPVDVAKPERDPARVSFLRRHLDAALDALEHGIPLRGYFVWSLLDNFEWAQGYGPRFGIVHVDYRTQERRVRDSARFIGAVARSGRLPPDGDAPTDDRPASARLPY
jgi:beta-glucosidase